MLKSGASDLVPFEIILHCFPAPHSNKVKTFECRWYLYHGLGFILRCKSPLVAIILNGLDGIWSSLCSGVLISAHLPGTQKIEVLQAFQWAVTVYLCFRELNHSRTVCWGSLWWFGFEPIDICTCNSSGHTSADWWLSNRQYYWRELWPEGYYQGNWFHGP